MSKAAPSERGLTAPWLRWGLSLSLGVALLFGLEAAARLRATSPGPHLAGGVEWVRLAPPARPAPRTSTARPHRTPPAVPAPEPVPSEIPASVAPEAKVPAARPAQTPPDVQGRTPPEPAMPARDVPRAPAAEPLKHRRKIPATFAAAAPLRKPEAMHPPPQPPAPNREVATAEQVPPPVTGAPASAASTAVRPTAPLRTVPLHSQGETPDAPAPAPPTPGATRSRPRSPLVSPAELDAGFGPVRPVRPAFPERARRFGRSGEVQLEVLIDEGGKVAEVKVVRETAGWGFGEAARDAFSRARFTPPTAAGRPVRVLWRKTLVFRP